MALPEIIKDIEARIIRPNSTDNAIVRFDGTTGQVQNSVLLIDDNGKVTAPRMIHSNSISTDTDLSRIPAETEIVLETSSGNGTDSVWLWREKWTSSNYGIFHDNSADVIHAVGGGFSKFQINLTNGSTGIHGNLTVDGNAQIEGAMTVSSGLTVSGDANITNLLTIGTNASHYGIKAGDTYISSISKNLIFQNVDQIRFGGDSWDYNVWAGLKYDHSTKTIYLGLADGSIFTANTPQSGGTLSLPAITKIIQGSPSTDSTITNMNRFQSDLFVQGNGAAPNTPKVAGFYLGKSQSDENRHMDIVSGSDYAYIDFNKASVLEDYKVRLIANVDTGLTEFTWGGNAISKILSISGNVIANNMTLNNNLTVNNTGIFSGLLNAHGGISLNEATPQETPAYILGIRAFAHGGNIIWQTTDLVSVGNATNANYSNLWKINSPLTTNSTRSTRVGSWNGAVSGLSYVYNQSWFDSSISSDSGDITLGLRPAIYTSGGTELCMMIDGDYYSMGNKVLHAGNYNTYAPTKTGGGASGTWGIAITGNAATATALTSSAGSTGQAIYFASGKPAAIDWRIGNSGVGEHNCNNIAYNFCGYYTTNGPATSIGATTADGAIWSQAYSTSWVAQIAQDYRDGDLFVRGKNNGTWTAWKRIWATGDAVTGAVWNDYAECREADTIEPGYVLVEMGDDTLTKSTERLSPFAGVSSDTWGFSQGETDKAKTPIAVAGRVLVYPWQDRNNYKPGDCVCAAPDGKVDIMTREEVIQYPDRIVGTVSSVPTYDKWGGGEMADREPVDVNGRIWIK